MPRDEQDHRPQDLKDLEDTLSDAEIDAEEELDDEDFENVAGGWSGKDGGKR